MRQLVLKLHHVSESMHSTLAELEQSLHEDEISGGMAPLVEPQKRFKQEQMMNGLAQMRQESQADFHEATELLLRLIELTEPSDGNAASTFNRMQPQTHDSLGAITEDEHEGLIDISPPRVVEHRAMMREVWEQMNGDISQGGLFFRTPGGGDRVNTAQHVANALADASSSGGLPQLEGPKPDVPTTRGLQPASASHDSSGAAAELALLHPKVSREGAAGAVSALGGTAEEPTMVAIADFVPPVSHQTQMLRLYVGDHVVVIGRDGRGWWYGRTANGKEGWFPPSYVQLESAHFTSGTASARK